MLLVVELYMLLGLYSLSGKTAYRQISLSLEAARLDIAMVVSLWFDRHLGSSALTLTAEWLSIGTLGTNFSEILIKIQNLCIHEIAFENIVCEITTIFSRGRWVENSACD